MSFTYVKIPVSLESPIEEITASKSGGLDNDELIKQAKDYFHKQGHTDHPSCDIMALSIPLAGNNFRAVSLYANDNQESLHENKRATSLVTACGHTLVSPIRGDVFLGRAHDDESIEWERDNFTIQDANPTSDWCRVARSLGGGGGQGGKAMPSLNSLVQQQVLNMGRGASNGTSPPQVIAPPNHTATGALYGMDGAPPVEETWGSWIQTSDEIELKFVIPESCKGKDCKISFQRNQLSVSIQNDIKLKGPLFASIVPDECTYTIESTKNGSKELCITLTKAKEDSTWSFITS